MKRIASSAGRLLLSGTLLAVPSARALAESTDVFQFLQEEATVVTATMQKTRVSEAPATVYVITQNDIRLRGYANLKDVLRDLPGMETIENYFSETGTLVPIRGVVGNNKIVVLVNGMRVNPPGGEDMPLRSDFDVREAEQIEVVYGPGSTLYGQDAISAVINVITKKPQEKLMASINYSYGVNSFNDGGAAISKKGENAAVSAYAQYAHSGMTDLSRAYPDWWPHNAMLASSGNNGTVPSRWDRGFNGFFRLENENNSLQIWHRESSRSSAEGGLTGVIGFVDQAVWHDRSTVMEGKNTFELSDRLSLESRLTINRYEIDPGSRYVEPLNGTSWFLNDNKYGLGKAATLEERVSYEPREGLSILGGAEASDNSILPKATVPGGADTNKDIATQAGTLSYYTRLGDPSSRVDVPRANPQQYENFSAYAEAHWQALRQVQLIAGGRLDHNTRYGSNPVTPRLSAVYRPWDAWAFKYIYTRAYVSPPPYYGYNILDNGVVLNTINPDLKPEKSQSHEVNATYNGRGISAGLSGYWNKQEDILVIGDNATAVNIIQQVVYLDLAGTQTRVLTHSANGGSSVSKGFDLYGTYKSGPLSLWSSYSYVNFRSDSGGMVTGLPQISRHNIRLGVTYQVLRHLFATPSLIVRSTPENFGNTFNLTNETKNPYEVNLHLLWELRRDWSLFGDFQNITNHHSALKGIIGPTPQDTFHGSVGAEYRFGGQK